MRMRVNHEMLNDVIKVSLADYQALFKEIEDMEKEINNLKNIWQGEEAAIFYTRIDNYLGNLKSIPETYNTFAKFMTRANKLYKEADNNFADDINKVRNS
ncbi:MAG: WXG100 family type VII secretion target [Bacilli bacterium]|nr:WXG100 family type VII secretion target [Bacilli bacterium]